MYCSINDLLKEFTTTELSDLTGYTSSSGGYDDRINTAINNASATIDAYLSDKYQTPIAEPVPELIKIIAIDLTIYNLYENAFKTSEIPNTIVWRKSEANKMLNDLKNGTLSINSGSIDYDSITNKQIIINKTETDRIFTKIILDSYF